MAIISEICSVIVDHRQLSEAIPLDISLYSPPFPSHPSNMIHVTGPNPTYETRVSL